jgi:hypothetical protein
MLKIVREKVKSSDENEEILESMKGMMKTRKYLKKMKLKSLMKTRKYLELENDKTHNEKEKIHRETSGETPGKREEIIGAGSDTEINKNALKQQDTIQKMQMLTMFLLTMI